MTGPAPRSGRFGPTATAVFAQDATAPVVADTDRTAPSLVEVQAAYTAVTEEPSRSPTPTPGRTVG
jgi:hypothetical protein